MTDLFIYGGLSLRFHSVLLFSPASSIFGAFYRGWSASSIFGTCFPMCLPSSILFYLLFLLFIIFCNESI